MSFLIGQLIGSLVITYVVSRLFLKLLRSWPNKIAKVFVANGITWLLAAFVGGIGMADGGAFAGLKAAGIYGVPCLIWLIFDLLFPKQPEERSSH